MYKKIEISNTIKNCLNKIVEAQIEMVRSQLLVARLQRQLVDIRETECQVVDFCWEVNQKGGLKNFFVVSDLTKEEIEKIQEINLGIFRALNL